MEAEAVTDSPLRWVGGWVAQGGGEGPHLHCNSRGGCGGGGTAFATVLVGCMWLKNLSSWLFPAVGKDKQGNQGTGGHAHSLICSPAVCVLQGQHGPPAVVSGITLAAGSSKQADLWVMVVPGA